MKKSSTKTEKPKIDIYELVTDRIIAQLEQGEIPWQKPWDAKVGRPKNLITDKEYQGMNMVMLGSQKYDNPYWLTYKQCTEKGGNVKKGEKGSVIVFWSFLDKATGKPAERETDSPEPAPAGKGSLPILRYYTVFNANQCENLLTPKIEPPPLPANPLEEAERIIREMPGAPPIKHGFINACNSPGKSANPLATRSTPKKSW